MVQLDPLTVIISASVVVAKVVPKPIVSSKAKSVFFIRISCLLRWPTIILHSEHVTLSKRITKPIIKISNLVSTRYGFEFQRLKSKISVLYDKASVCSPGRSDHLQRHLRLGQIRIQL